MKAARSLVVTIATLTALGAVLVASAEADKDKPKLAFKKIEPDLVAGKLKGASKSCTKGRKVVLKYSPGTGLTRSKFVKLGTAKTNKKGKWKRPGEYFVGTYKAILKPSKARGRALPARKEDGIVEEEAEEEDWLDDDAEAAHSRGKTCTGTSTKSKES